MAGATAHERRPLVHLLKVVELPRRPAWFAAGVREDGVPQFLDKSISLICFWAIAHLPVQLAVAAADGQQSNRSFFLRDRREVDNTESDFRPHALLFDTLT